MQADNKDQVIIRLPEVMRRTGISRSSIYAYMKESKFPQAVKLGERAIGWYQSDVDEWIKGRLSKSFGYSPENKG